MPVPTELPYEWATDPGARVEPPVSLQETGFVPGVPVGAGVMNDLFGRIAAWAVYLSRAPAYHETVEALIAALSAGEVGILYEASGWPYAAVDTLAGADPIVDADGQAVLVMRAAAAVRISRTDLSTVLATCTHSNAGTPEDAVSDGAHVVVGYGNFIELFNAQTGAALFDYDHGADVNAVAMGVFFGTKLAYLAGALGTGTKYVRAIRFSDGVEEWSYNHGAEVYDIACDGRRVYIVGAAGSGGATVRCLEANNGGVVWSASPGTFVTSKIVTDGARVFVAGAGADALEMTIYPADDNTALGTKAFNAAATDIRHVAIDHEYLYVAEYDSVGPSMTVQIVDKATLASVWSIGTATAGELLSIAADPGALYSSLKRYDRPGRPSLFARIDPATHEFNPYGWLVLPTAR